MSRSIHFCKIRSSILSYSQGANIEAQDELRHTPLWKACLVSQNLFVIRFLIKAGANKTHDNKTGQSILQMLLNGADFQGKEEVIRLLKE